MFMINNLQQYQSILHHYQLIYFNNNTFSSTLNLRIKLQLINQFIRIHLQLIQYYKYLSYIMSRPQKSRQTTIIQIFRQLKSRKNMTEINIDQYIDPKKEEIYESGQDSPINNQTTNQRSSKKEPKLFGFLAKIDEDFKEQMQEFLVKNKQQYESRVNPPKSITLYEDILIIWAFKRAQTDIKKSKKQGVDKLIKELQETIKKSQVTIKQRIQKKLSNLNIEQIREKMKTKKDISFNQKKQLINKLKNTPPAKINHSNEEQFNDVKTTSNYPIQKSIIFNDQKSQMKKAQQINRFQSKLRKIQQQSSFNSLNSGKIYKYGTKLMDQKIKFLYNPQQKAIICFKRSQFQDFKTSSQKQIQISSAEQIIQAPISNANRFQIQIKNEQIKQIKPIQPVKIDKKNMESINQYFEKQQLIQKPQKLQHYIQQIRSQTLKALTELQTCQNNQTISKNVKQLEEKLILISELQNQMNFTNKQNMSPSKQQNYVDKQADKSSEEEMEYSNAKKDRINLAKAPSTGKKTLFQQQSSSDRVERNLVEEMSPVEANMQLQQLMKMLSNNVYYLQIVKQDPSKLKHYIWSDDEDKILWSFKFSPTSYRQQMVCLARYKDFNMILERMRYLKMDIDPKLNQQLERLRPEGRVLQGQKDASNTEKEMYKMEVQPEIAS